VNAGAALMAIVEARALSLGRPFTGISVKCPGSSASGATVVMCGWSKASGLTVGLRFGCAEAYAEVSGHV